MTNPGFQPHQAVHQARQAESFRAGQYATDRALQLGRQYQRGRGRAGASAHQSGSAVIRMFGRLIRFVITSAIIAGALGISALVLNQADPSLYHQAVAWLKHL